MLSPGRFLVSTSMAAYFLPPAGLTELFAFSRAKSQSPSTGYP